MLSSDYSSETTTTTSEDSAILAVELALPEERQRIMKVLRVAEPLQDSTGRLGETPLRETKVENLIKALGSLWKQDATEQVVIFASVDLYGGGS